MAKTLCKWKRAEYLSELQKLRKAVSGARYVCCKCGRAARAEKRLCDPQPIDEKA